MDEVAPGYVAVARVLGAWGTRGGMKVELFAPETLLTRGRTVSVSGRKYEIQEFRRAGRFYHLKATGIEHRDQASALRDKFLQVPETELDPLPPGEFYRFQLIGLMVCGSDGTNLGLITDVISAPENDVYVVWGPDGEVLVPAIDDVVLAVDLEARVVTVEIVPGLLP